MDKAQKELIGTYFRKRDIARKQNVEKYGYKSHEILYKLNNDVLDINKLDLEEITDLLMELPELIDRIKSSRLNKLDEFSIKDILIAQPQLVNRFDLNKFDDWNIREILMKRPELIDAQGLNGSKMNLNLLNNNDMQYLLKQQPTLAKYFNKQ